MSNQKRPDTPKTEAVDSPAANQPQHDDNVSTLADVANEEDKAWRRWHNLD